ncbi:MAG: hypothetical protein PHU63_03365 [Candidatus ainarchaeum sp.]|nr:hypothetical protein [Candidatus ainarchaeum sp.]
MRNKNPSRRSYTFGKKPYTESRVGFFEISPIAERIRGMQRVSPNQSTSYLLYGNDLFADILRHEGVRLSKLSGKGIGEILLVCADARAGMVLDARLQIRSSSTVVFSAGNTFSEQEPSSNATFQSLLLNARKKTPVKVVGHSHCGAVHHADGKGNLGQPRDIRLLLDTVTPYSVEENANVQARRLIEMATSLGARVSISAHVFDWDSSTKPIAVVDETTSLMSRSFRYSMRGYRGTLNTQYAHAVIVTSVNDDPHIPFTPRELFGITQPNDVFCVTANGLNNIAPGFDSISKGSILYTLMNNQTSNIVLVHSDQAVLNAWKQELHTWLTNLTSSTDPREQEIGSKYSKGEIAITPMAFEFSTGRAFPIE